MFIVQVICITANDENKDIIRFMDSFDIIKTNNQKIYYKVDKPVTN